MSWFKKKKIDDWMLLHALRGKWKITRGKDDKYDDYCNYEIMYSPSADKVKIEMNGYKPKGHILYEHVMKILSLYNEAILSNKSFNGIKKEIDEIIDFSKEKK